MLAPDMAQPETIILTAEDAHALLDPAELLPRLREAFAEYSTRRIVPARRYPVVLPQTLETGAGGMVLAPGLVPGIPAYTVKVNAKFPGTTPSIKGAILLHDLDTGDLLAILESGYITAVRTGLAGALGADVLARRDASRVAIVGAGTQGRVQLASLARVRKIEAVSVFDQVTNFVMQFASERHEGIDCDVTVAESVEQAVVEADIIVSSTWASEPFLHEGMVQQGAHVTTLGPDSPGKAEVDAALIQSSLFVCDDRELAVEMGAVGGVGLGADVIDAELGEVIAGTKPGRTSDDQVTVFGSVGLAFQDLAAAWLVYEKARANDCGQAISLS